ncbi:non-specific serine/threonine protein kinase [Ranunculus cassubicifolius]
MNPKISDFGMAKLVMADQSQGITSRVVGTYGYMAPEYAMHGEFSVKSDVFSFGVLVLEIITGQKNSNSYVSEISEDLLSHAWKQWEKGNGQELLQPSLREEYSVTEVMRCVHIGLLCVQKDAAKRPTMATIVLMLSSYSVSLPLPPAPAYFPSTFTMNVDTISEGLEKNSDDPSQTILEDRSDSSSMPLSVNDASITELYPR